MNGRFQRISDLFEHARQLPDAAARSSYLDAECEAEMRAEVNALLAAYDEDRGRDPRRDSAVLPGLGEAVAAAWNTTQSEPAAPELVEGFRILERIGSGGMGTVYAAQQIEPARRVALKVLRPEADRDRFRREVLALARLQHPGIAQILLSGECATPAGRVPFLAMELIDGVPVDRFAQSLGRPARVDLLIRIAEAVAHAHRRGIIHRDLKPSNILVTPDGQPKVLDFGLARATDDSDDGFGRQTKTGHLVGTLAYMSPEQASGARDAVDTRADIYALGVIGYEVLTGKLPHALDDLPLQRALQTLTDTDPEGIPDLRGDLWIILRKALAKDPEMRYGSASALASDLRRYRSDEPITARAPSTMYQLQKFVRRHKAPVFGAIATILALVVGLVLAVRAAGREADERIRADLERDAARAAAAHAYLRAATGDMATHEYGSARRHLDNIPPSFRDWEWAYLASRLDRSVEFRPFPAGADAETVLRGETAAHAPSGRIFGHRFRVRQSTLTDEANGTTLELAGLTLPIRSVRGSKDGRLLAVTTGQDAQNTQRIHVFDAATGAPVRTVLGSVGANGVVDFDGNGARIVFGGFRGWTVAYEIASGRRLFAFHNHGGDDTSAVAFGPGDRIATGGFDRSVHVLDARTGEIRHVLRGHSGKIRGLVFTPDGRSVVSSAEDGTIRIWDIAAERLLDVIAVPTPYVGPLALDATGHDLWAMCGDGYRRYRLDGSKLDRFRVHDTFVYAVAFHPDGRTLATGSHGQGVRVVDTATGAALSPRADRRVWDLAFHPDGTLYSTSHRYAAPSWTAMRTDAMPNGGRALAVAPDGSRVVGGAGRADALRLYRPASGEIEAEWEGTPRSIEALAFSADGEHVALGTKSGILEVRAVPSGTVVFRVEYGKKIYGVAFHPTRSRVAVGVDRVIHIRDWRSGATVAELVGHRDIVWELVYHPSGTRLFSASHDTTVRVWDPESGREKLRLPGHRNYVHDLALSPDGRTLATASGDYHVRIFSTRPFAERWAEAHE